MSDIIHHAARRRLRQDYVEFRIIGVATFPIFFVAAIIGRIMPQRGLARSDRREGLSLIAEARAMADCALPWAYIR